MKIVLVEPTANFGNYFLAFYFVDKYNIRKSARSTSEIFLKM